jgi:hypothetical protein
MIELQFLWRINCNKWQTEMQHQKHCRRSFE